MQSSSPVDTEKIVPYFVDKKNYHKEQQSAGDKKDKGGVSSIVKGIKALLGDVEMAPYTVVVENEGFEERLYPARRWVCTTMAGPEKEALVSPMFRKLFNYISGKNERNLRMDMTAPVTTLVEPRFGPTSPYTVTMAFFIPQEHQSGPPAGAADVFIQDRPEMTVFSRRFGGYATSEIVAKEAKKLEELIRASGVTDVDFSRYYMAGYDPPFKPINRRNEVWFVKTPSTLNTPTSDSTSDPASTSSTPEE